MGQGLGPDKVLICPQILPGRLPIILVRTENAFLGLQCKILEYMNYVKILKSLASDLIFPVVE